MAPGRVVIAGAAGRIGRLLRAHLQGQGVALLLFDRAPGADPTVVAADLSRPELGWAERLRPDDTLVYLAADPRPDADWPSLERDNLDALLNVLQVAASHDMPRVVLASSVQTMLGQVGRAPRIGTDLPRAPINLYGVTKCVAERLGEHYARHFGLSVIALRIGWVQEGDNRPGSQMGPIRDQQIWLSNRDCCTGLVSAIWAPADLRFGIFNLVSDNAGMPWDLSENLRLLGWAPSDHYEPQEPVPDAQPPAREPPLKTPRRLRLLRFPLDWVCKWLRAYREA
jgi:nucleoside-diphosphate-sugar epimerase